jgi:hypothetical protein
MIRMSNSGLALHWLGILISRLAITVPQDGITYASTEVKPFPIIFSEIKLCSWHKQKFTGARPLPKQSRPVRAFSLEDPYRCGDCPCAGAAADGAA